jgi:hypothetical protein
VYLARPHTLSGPSMRGVARPIGDVVGVCGVCIVCMVRSFTAISLPLVFSLVNQGLMPKILLRWN